MVFRNGPRWRSISWIVLLCVTAFFVDGCRRKPRIASPLDFVPPQADVIVVMDYARFIKDPILRQVLDVSQIEPVLSRIGVQSDSISEIAGFVQINPAVLTSLDERRSEEDPGDFGIIVEGNGLPSKVIKSLEPEEWVRREYNGRRLWEAVEGPLAVASVKGNILAAGTPAAVRQVLDVARGKSTPAIRPASKNDSATILRQMGATGEVNIAIAFSQEMRIAAGQLGDSAGIFAGMTGSNMLGGVLDVLGSGRGIGISFGGKEDGIASRIVFVAKDVAGAKLIAGIASLAKIVIPGISHLAGPGTEELARGVEVKSKNNFVFIDLKIPKSIIRMPPQQTP